MRARNSENTDFKPGGKLIRFKDSRKCGES